MRNATAKKTGRFSKDQPVNKSVIQNEQEAKVERPLRLKYRESLKVYPQGEYYVETDFAFLEDIEKITKTRENALVTFLENSKKKVLTDEECDEIDFLARLHYKANIVNQNTDNELDTIEQKYRCNCGCERAKGQPLSLLASIKEMSILGSGVVLLFMFKKTFSFILLSAVVIYAIFAIVTNLMGSSSTTVSECEDAYCEYRTKASSENKLEPGLFTIIQWWMGVGFCFVWIFILRMIKYFGKNADQNIDQCLNSSSDYAVIMQNLPYGEYDEQQLAAYFDLLYEKAMKMTPEIQKQIRERNLDTQIEADIRGPFQQQKQKNKFNMKNIQIIYNMEFSRIIIQKVISLGLSLKYLCELHEQTKQMRINEKYIDSYKQTKHQICQTFEFLTDLRKKFFYDGNFRKDLSTTVAIVQFYRPQDKDFFLKYFGNQKVGIMKEVQEKIKSYFKKPSRTVMFRGNVLKIMRAPEPSDIIYTNCEKRFSITRFLVIWMITFAIIIVSFGIITLLMFIQDYLSKSSEANKTKTDSDGQDDTTITVLNIVISVGLQIVNRFLWFALFYILDMEYNHTMTQKIISQMNKVLIATCINIIVLPIISNFVIRNNVYGSKGLAGMVFDYQISVLGVGLVMKLIDPGIFIKRVLLMVRPIRNVIIRFLCENLGEVNPTKGVPEINSFYEGGYFNIAESYVYIMAATFQAAFFCQLQPSLLILVTFVVIFFYWVNKYKVLRTCKIPQITEILIFETALSQAAMIPIVYGTGSIVISYIQNHYNPNLPVSYLPAFISIGIGFFGFSNPGDWLNKFVTFILDKIVTKQGNSGGKSEQPSISVQGINDKRSQMDYLTDEIVEPQIMNRLDNYFRNTNSLPLVGFEHMLSGGQANQFPISAMNELERFCQKFVQNEEQDKKLQKKIKEVIVNKITQQGQAFDTLFKNTSLPKSRQSFSMAKDLNNLAAKGRNSQRVSNVTNMRLSKFKLPKIQNRFSENIQKN